MWAPAIWVNACACNCRRSGQTQTLMPSTLQVALRICAQPMDLLARRDIKHLVPLCDASDAQVRAAIALIGRLEPKPGRRFVDVERNIVVPDVLVVAVGQGPMVKFQVRLNPEVMPRLRVHDIYANALKGHKGGGSDAANLPRCSSACRRRAGSSRTSSSALTPSCASARAIVERQKSFFIHGELAMRPLVLREIADELGLHESTISRVTTAKYMATPFGTFELKYFFGSGLGTESGGNASSTAVRALIKQFVAAESPKKPLSDNQMSDMLKEQGIECARRTVAKYREGLRIAPASLKEILVNQLQLFLPCAAGVEDYLAAEVLRITGLPPGCITKQRGGVAVRTSLARRHAAEPAQPPGAARAGAAVVHRLPQRAGPVPRRHRGGLGDLVHPERSIKVEITAQHSPLTCLNFAALKIKDAVCDRFRDKAMACAPT